MICNFLYAADNKCISCHENVCTEKSDSCTLCHKGDNSTSRKDIAHYKLIKGKYASYTDINNIKTQKGIKIIENAGCTRCHNIGKNGSALASDLNSAVKRLTTDELINAIKEPVINMPYFQFSDENITELITAIYHNTIPEKSKSITQIIHFQDNTDDNDIFQKKCGSCHKAVTDIGALGNSEDAPNLSSLSKVYPEYLNGKNWNKSLLDKWLMNPRNLKKNAVMPVTELTDNEKKVIIDILVE